MKRTPHTVGMGLAVRTDAEIAAELNRRHSTTRYNRANVAMCRCKAEHKLRELLTPILEQLTHERQVR